MFSLKNVVIIRLTGNIIYTARLLLVTIIIVNASKHFKYNVILSVIDLSIVFSIYCIVPPDGGPSVPPDTEEESTSTIPSMLTLIRVY